MKNKNVVDINDVVMIYQEKLTISEHENVMLKAQVMKLNKEIEELKYNNEKKEEVSKCK